MIAQATNCGKPWDTPELGSLTHIPKELLLVGLDYRKLNAPSSSLSSSLEWPSNKILAKEVHWGRMGRGPGKILLTGQKGADSIAERELIFFSLHLDFSVAGVTGAIAALLWP